LEKENDSKAADHDPLPSNTPRSVKQLTVA